MYQDKAVEDVVDKILVKPSRTKKQVTNLIGAFVFMDPTGTGKTETAKALASNLGVKLVPFDMSEYLQRHSVSKLLGSPRICRT